MLLAVAVSFLLLWVESANACSLANGYFYQVTCLKGRLVGRSLGPMQFRWLRRAFSVPGAELTLYRYSDVFRRDQKPQPVAQVKADAAGYFDFGSIPEGHYRLKIVGTNLQDSFDVEITQSVPATTSIVIDISPIHPDCTGGHEFEVGG
jgi:hypothetical protein